MSQNDLHHIAQADSPQSVDIPNTPSGLLGWALVRFGPWVLGFVFAVLFYFDFKLERKENVSYQRSMVEKLMATVDKASTASTAQAEAMRAATTTDEKQTDAIRSLSSNIDENTAVLRELRDRQNRQQ
jgi:hypothetical protein